MAKNVVNSGSGNTNNQSPLPQAAKNGKDEVVPVKDGVDPDSRDKQSNFALVGGSKRAQGGGEAAAGQRRRRPGLQG